MSKVSEEVYTESEKNIDRLYRRLAELLDEDQWEEILTLLSVILREQARKTHPQMAPVAWRCRDFGDSWILFHSRGLAVHYQTQTGCFMQELIINPYQHITKEGRDE